MVPSSPSKPPEPATEIRPNFEERLGLNEMADAVAALREAGAEGATELVSAFEDAAATVGTEDDAIVAVRFHQIRIQHAKMIGSSGEPSTILRE